jgi:Tfp pilus tip-associated adhesin PilY1
MKLGYWCSSLLVFLAGLCAASFAGQFGPVAKYKIGGSGYSVALADFNGDGVLDIAVTTQLPDFRVWVLLGNGDGTFQPPKSYPGSACDLVKGLVTGDFNKDGKVDLAVASADSHGGGLNILLGNGDGTFQSPVCYPAGPFPVTVAVADLNGDGNPDVVVESPFIYSGGNGSVAVLLGNGDGTFQPYMSYAAGMVPNSVAVTDLNGDHILDLATGTTGSIVAVLLGNGDGTFQKAIRNHIGANPHYVGIGDFNNDGKVDVITTLENTTAGQNKVVIALGNGDGTLQAPITLTSPPKPQATAVADFNLDGFDDIVIGAPKSPLDGIYFLLGQGNATFVHDENYATGPLVPTAMAVGDLNGDGYPDLVILDGSDSVAVLLNTGTAR